MKTENKTESRVDLSEIRDGQDLPREGNGRFVSGNAHTPGPWQVVQMTRLGANTYIFAEPFDAQWSPIAEHVNGQDNARLIAAAPDLLASLREMVAGYSGSTLDICSPQTRAKVQRARAAIARAEGR